MAELGNAARLALGTFLALPVSAPSRIDRGVAGTAMLLAPLTALPAALVWVLLGLGVVHLGAPPLACAALALVLTTLMSRAMHLDGLADTADGLTSGYDRERSLEVMRRGDTGPAGAAAVVLSLLLQFACLATLFATSTGGAVAAVALVASRLAPAVACRTGMPAARPGGLGATVAGSVSGVRLGGAIVLILGLAVLAGLGTPRPYAATLAAVTAVAAAWLVTLRARARLGGITGDTIGAAIEVALSAALLVGALATTLAA